MKTAVIVLNWNGEEDSLACIKALKNQTQTHQIIAVDNGSTDNFKQIIESKHSEVKLLVNQNNKGFAGGVNTGIQYAIEKGFELIALINNDAIPDKTWLAELVSQSSDKNIGIVTGKLLKNDGTIDSTGDQYTSWGLAYPRGRNEDDTNQYDSVENIFGATGGASLYKAEMLRDIGLFDEDFFAYYEDVDISFRAQLAGWKVVYTPKAIAHHKIGASSGKIKGFTTYQTVKNLPWLFWKNVPLYLLPKMLPRFTIAYTSIVFSSLAKGKILPVIKGLAVTNTLMPKKLLQRHSIQSRNNVDANYIKSIINYDLPPNASRLIRLRSVVNRLFFWR